MAIKKQKKDPGKYPTYGQYGFRATGKEIKLIQDEIDALYLKFNKGRDPQDPKDRKAVKVSDIALKALRMGLAALKGRSKWEFDE